MKFLDNKWSIFFSTHTNKIINEAHSKIIELYIKKSETPYDKIEEIHKIDSQIESWKWTIEFNRDRQRLDRYPIIVLLSGIIGSLLTLYFTQ